MLSSPSIVHVSVPVSWIPSCAVKTSPFTSILCVANVPCPLEAYRFLSCAHW